MQRTLEEKTELFETMPIRRAAMTLVIPTVISQLVMLVYNMADTWYIGQTGDPYQVAAVTVTYPIFMLMNALANLFGIGGSSLLSRMLGGGEQKKTGAIAAFSLWTSGGVTLCYSLLCLFFDRQFLTLLGTDAGTLPYAQAYLFWTVVIGGLPTVLNMVLANIVRAQGDARISSIGMSIGGVLNMVMDPVFIFLMGMGVAGAALSTCLSNTVSLIFLLIHVIRNRETSLVKIPLLPQPTEHRRRMEIYSIGTPAALQILLAAVSNAVLLRFFINDAQSILYGAAFVRLRVLALPFITVEFMLIAVFQGIGGAKQAFFLSLFRKGILDLPLMALFNLLLPMYGLMLVQPLMECCGAIIAVMLYKKLQNSLVPAKLPGPTQIK